MENFKLNIFKYVNGLLEIAEQWFENIEDAINAGRISVCDQFKVHDKDGNICHDSDTQHDTYA